MIEYPLAKCEECGVLIAAACPICVDCERKQEQEKPNQEEQCQS